MALAPGTEASVPDGGPREGSIERHRETVAQVFRDWDVCRRGVISQQHLENVLRKLLPQWGSWDSRKDMLLHEALVPEGWSADGPAVVSYEDWLDFIFNVARPMPGDGDGDGGDLAGDAGGAADEADDQPDASGSRPVRRLAAPEMVSRLKGSYELTSFSGDRKAGQYTFYPDTGHLVDSQDGCVGTFSMDVVSDAPLPDVAGNAELPVIQVLNSEIMAEIQNPDNAGAFFVLPSQLNGAEYPANDVVITELQAYCEDNTGGPRGQLAVHPAAGQFVLDNAASSKHAAGINAAAAVLRATDDWGFDLENGYLVVPTDGTSEEQDRAVASMRANLHMLRMLVMEETPATGLAPDKWSLAMPPHRVSLVYASAVPVQSYMNQGGEREELFQTRVGAEVLRAQYLGSLRMAARAGRLPDGQPRRVLLSLLGGGIFNNPWEQIIGAMSEAVELLTPEELALLDIRALAWKGNPSEHQEMERLLQSAGKFGGALSADGGFEICPHCGVRSREPETPGALFQDVWHCEVCYASLLGYIGEEEIDIEGVQLVIDEWAKDNPGTPLDLFVGAGADDYAGWTCLHLLTMNETAAADGTSEKVWRLLLQARDRGILKFAGDENTWRGFTPLLQAANMLKFRSVWETLRALAPAEDFKVLFANALPKDYSPTVKEDLLQAAADGDVALVQKSLSAGAPVNCQDRRGRSPVFLAVVNKRQDVLRALLDQGGKADTGGWHDYTPVHAAAQLNDVESLAEMAARDPQGFADALDNLTTARLSPYLLAVSVHSMEAAKWLTEAERWASDEELTAALADGDHFAKATTLWRLASSTPDRFQLYSRFLEVTPNSAEYPEEVKGSDEDYGFRTVLKAEVTLRKDLCEQVCERVLLPVIEAARAMDEGITGEVRKFQGYALRAMALLPSDEGSESFEIKELLSEKAVGAMHALEELLGSVYAQAPDELKDLFPEVVSGVTELRAWRKAAGMEHLGEAAPLPGRGARATGRTRIKAEYLKRPYCFDPAIAKSTPCPSVDITIALFKVGAFTSLSDFMHYVHRMASDYYSLSQEDQEATRFVDLFGARSLVRWQLTYAARRNPVFQHVMSVEEGVGPRMHAGPVKAEPRVLVKAREEWSPELRQLAEDPHRNARAIAEAGIPGMAEAMDHICDIVRCSCACQDAAEFVQTVRQVMSWTVEKDGKEVVRVKHGYHREFNAEKTYGYRDCKLNIIFGNSNSDVEARLDDPSGSVGLSDGQQWQVAELQVLLSKPLQIKEFQHVLYKIVRGDIR